MQLALLADRIRRPDGVTESWQSPDGVPLHIAAAWARWPWTDLADALQPNGRLGLDTYASPVGVDDRGLRQRPLRPGQHERLRRAARRRPRRRPHRLEPAAEPGRALRRGRPRDPQADPHLPRRARAADRQGDHAAAHPVGLDRRPLPRRPGPAHLRPAAPEEQDARRSRCSSATSATARAANHPGDIAAFNAQGLAFFEARLRHAGGSGPAPGSVTAYTQTCPKTRHTRRRPATARRPSRRSRAGSSSSATRPPSA